MAGGATKDRKNVDRKSAGGRARHVFRMVLVLALLAVAGCFGWLAYEYSKLDIPAPDAFALSQASRAYYSDGVTEIGALSTESRKVIDCTALPGYVGNAIVASENRTFWTDGGIDVKGIARALFNNATTGSRQGGSTITQQYAERYYLGQTDTYEGKVREALLAVKIARTQSKETVLCNYMNTIYFGRGAYGIEEASLRYFGVPAAQMTMPQAALLAGIIPAPSVWDPAVSHSQAERRFMRVIAIMREDGYITSEEANTALMPDTVEPSSADSLSWSGPNGYLLSLVSSELTASGALAAVDLAQGGYTVVTTLDAGLQDAMVQAVSRTGNPDGVETGAMAADPTTGAVLAAWGGEDYAAKQLNNATQAVYEPGSTMKAFSLIAASQAGVPMAADCSAGAGGGAASAEGDESGANGADDGMPSGCYDGDSPQYFAGIATPVANAHDRSYGTVNLTQATAASVNTVFMQVAEDVGPATVAEIAHDAGISSDLTDDSPFITLGIDAVTVRDMTQAYATIAAGGMRTALHTVARVTGPAGTVIYEAGGLESTQAFAASDAANATSALKTVFQTGGTAAGEGAALAANGVDTNDLAGKTGTANDATARSIVGYTPGIVTTFAVWNPGSDGSALKLPEWNGNEACEGLPGAMFTRFMTTALAR